MKIKVNHTSFHTCNCAIFLEKIKACAYVSETNKTSLNFVRLKQHPLLIQWVRWYLYRFRPLLPCINADTPIYPHGTCIMYRVNHEDVRYLKYNCTKIKENINTPGWNYHSANIFSLYLM